VRDITRLADEQRARYARTCGIVLDHEICGRVLGVSPVSGQGCHDHSVLEGDSADVNRLEELGSGHCKADVCVGGFSDAVFIAYSPLLWSSSPR